MKVWNKNFHVGKKIYIVKEPNNAKKEGLLLGEVFEIVEPPKNHLNTAMAVWIVGKKTGKKMCVSFPYAQYLPKGAKVNMDRLLKKDTEIVEPKVYREELENTYSFTEFEKVVEAVKVVRKRKTEPVVVRRRRRN